MNAAQKLTKRVMKREPEVIAKFMATAQAAGIAPAALAMTAVIIFADLGSKAVRLFAQACDPGVRSATIGPNMRVMFACDRARLLQIWTDPDLFPVLTKEAEALATMMQSPPALGFFWLVCVAEAPGARMLSWSASLIAWSIAGVAKQRCDGVTRDQALALWAKVVEVAPGFFDDYPRDKTGPLDDDEKAEIIQRLTRHLMKEFVS